MKHSTPDSMKFKKLKRRLGISTIVAVGTLELLWIATQKNAKRGDIGRYTNEEIAIECEWEGDPDELVDALVETGWIDRSVEHRLVIHDWSQHAPRYIHAWIKSQQVEFATGETVEVTVERTTVATVERTSEGGTPNLTKPNLTKPNEDSSESSSDASEPATAFAFGVVGNKGNQWTLPQSLFDVMVESYPGIDVAAECRKAIAWCVSNPSRRKTPSGMPKFLNSWMAREQNKRGDVERNRGGPKSDQQAKLNLRDKVKTALAGANR